MPKHKHAEVIKAWADGALVQCRTSLTNKGNWFDTDVPSFNLDYEYRVKPVKKSAGQVLKESNPSSLPHVHWDNLDASTKKFYELHAINFLEAWKKENE